MLTSCLFPAAVELTATENKPALDLGDLPSVVPPPPVGSGTGKGVFCLCFMLLAAPLRLTGVLCENGFGDFR
jgi:hypothetical protein